jgi:hypothetical protein
MSFPQKRPGFHPALSRPSTARKAIRRSESPGVFEDPRAPSGRSPPCSDSRVRRIQQVPRSMSRRWTAARLRLGPPPGSDTTACAHEPYTRESEAVDRQIGRRRLHHRRRLRLLQPVLQQWHRRQRRLWPQRPHQIEPEQLRGKQKERVRQQPLCCELSLKNLSERGGLIGLVELAGAAAALRAHGQGGYFVSASWVSAPPYGRQEAQRDSGRATQM